MDQRTLESLLLQEENPKLDFKLEFYAIESKGQEFHWNELIKDIISLSNGNIGYAGQPGYLIIGAADKLDPDGRRPLRSCERNVAELRTQILRKINNVCNPKIPDLQIENFIVENCNIFIVTIPVNPYLHEITEDIQTPKRRFNEGTVLIRRGEDIHPANEAERNAIKREKERFNGTRRETGSLDSLERRKKMAVTETLREQITTIRRLALRLQGTAVTALPETLYLQIGDDAELSPWGELIWQQTRSELYAEQLWPSPSPLLVYGPRFADSIKKLAPDRRATINERIDDLARYLEHPDHPNVKRLDFKRLKHNPYPPATHECDAWADEGAKRLFGHYEGDRFVLDALDKHL
ncbi:MAG: helix-turn-helix domain-containing protein [Oscillochloridaceae bacterium umkhey_bin13]